MSNRTDSAGLGGIGGDREGFFGRISAALGREGKAIETPAVPAGHPALDERLLRQVSVGDASLVERWVQKASGNSMVVRRVGPAGVVGAIDECLGKHEISSLLLNAEPFGTSLGLVEHLAGKGIQAFCWGEAGCRDRAFTANAAITTCRYGLADAGSLVVWSEVGFGRSSTLTAAVHVVILRASQILADLVDAFARVAVEAVDGAGMLPSNVVVINGPSKTSDIEMQLVTGVHGPKYLYVILLDD